ncbi:hypothetical protein D3C80_1567580 [compost metagenome]
MRGKGAEQSDFQHADFFAASQQGVDRFFTGTDSGPHQDHDAFGLWMTVIFKRLIGPAGDLGKLVHRINHVLTGRVIPGIGGLTGLEIGIRVGGGTAHHGMVR